jgi:hypothetical protein
VQCVLCDMHFILHYNGSTDSVLCMHAEVIQQRMLNICTSFHLQLSGSMYISMLPLSWHCRPTRATAVIHCHVLVSCLCTFSTPLAYFSVIQQYAGYNLRWMIHDR